MSKEDVWKKDFIQETRNSGVATLMIWSCISSFSVGPLVFSIGSLYGPLYLKLLRKTVKPYLRSLQKAGMEDLQYMDDNASVQRARVVKKWMGSGRISNPEWPPYSPDLNPIENLWAYRKVPMFGNFDFIRSTSLPDQKSADIWKFQILFLDF